MNFFKYLLFGIGATLLLVSCIYPGPELERYSDSGQPSEGQGILHAYYELADTFHIFPASAKWEVIGVDGVSWSRPQRLDVNNRIPLQEGLHFVRFEGDYLLDRPYSLAIALDVKAGHEYELAEGFSIPPPFTGDRVKHWDTRFNVIQDGKIIQEIFVKTIAKRSTSSRTCRADADCLDDLVCVLLDETGFGMCGNSE